MSDAHAWIEVRPSQSGETLASATITQPGVQSLTFATLHRDPQAALNHALDFSLGMLRAARG